MTAELAKSPNIRKCARCGIAYDWRGSMSACLKMTYCNSLCERADLGFTIEALIRTEFVREDVVSTAQDAAELTESLEEFLGLKAAA